MAELTGQVLDQWGRNQETVCERFQVEWVEWPRGLKVGVARNVRSGLAPFERTSPSPAGRSHRLVLVGGRSAVPGPGLLLPLHVEHLAEWCPAAIPYLGLPPGWRFLVAPGREDVWFDENLLDV